MYYLSIYAQQNLANKVVRPLVLFTVGTLNNEILANGFFESVSVIVKVIDNSCLVLRVDNMMYYSVFPGMTKKVEIYIRLFKDIY